METRRGTPGHHEAIWPGGYRGRRRRRIASARANDRQTRPIWLDLLLTVIVPVACIAAIYLTPFAADRSTMPFGVDTSTYIWRVNVVHDLGLGALTPDVANAPKPLGDRPGYPIVLSLLRSVTGSSSLSLMWLTPALFACAVGLAAGSLASDGALERRRRSGAVAVAVGASAFVAWTAVGYAANLAFDVVAMGTGVMALEVGRGRRGLWGGAVLLAGGVLLHWMFAALFVVVLSVAAVVRFLGTRDRGAARVTTLRRTAAMLALGLTLGAVGLSLSPQHPGRLPEVDPTRPGPAGRLDLRLPAMALPVTLPLAGLGCALLATDRRRSRRDAAVFLAVWSSVAVISLIGWFVLALPLPPYRWAGFALAIPASVVLCGTVGADRLERSGRPRLASLAISLGLVATVALAGAGASVWWSREPTLASGEFAQLRTLSAYLEPLPTETPVVILIEGYRRRAPVNRAWAGLPAERLRFVTMVPARIRPHAADLGLGPDLLDQPETVVVVLDAYRRPMDVGRLIGPGVHLISGPVPHDLEAGEPPRAPPGIGLAFGLAGLLAILTLTGGGWAAALSDLPALGVVCVASPFAVAVLSGVGWLASRAGLPLHGPGGAGLVVAIAVLGWSAAIVRRRRANAATSVGAPGQDP